MKGYMKRIERLEVATGTDNTEQWLSLPPENDLYRLVKVAPMNKPQETKELTQAEYRRFKGELDGRIIEVRWANEKAE